VNLSIRTTPKTEDDDPNLFPIRLDSTSNGEFEPIAPSADVRYALQIAAKRIRANAARLSMSRRNFLRTACSAASVLLSLNQVFAATGKTGGYFEISKAMELDQGAAESKLSGSEFIFDVQTHYVSDRREWYKGYHAAGFLQDTAKQKCPGQFWVKCFAEDHYLKEVFLDSDTKVAVLSFIPQIPSNPALTLDEAQTTKQTVEKMEGSHRLQLHAPVMPNAGPLEQRLSEMDQISSKYKIQAWKIYPLWGRENNAWFMDDPKIGIPFIEKARKTGVKVICAHKGIPVTDWSPKHASCRDVGVVAKMFPDVTFIIYHAGFFPGHPEGPYDPKNARAGIDTLVHSLQENGVKPDSNVYVDLGSTWRMLMRNPNSAAHGIGKLLKYVGVNRVLWGTDSIWYGSPQDQIVAFRAFQISKEFQEKYGYPHLSEEVKKKVFGLNAAKPYNLNLTELLPQLENDPVAKAKSAYEPNPSYQTYGPRNRREFLQLVRLNKGMP
jgi:predicted TIM-barrel fold metal-dependent hydrolase